MSGLRRKLAALGLAASLLASVGTTFVPAGEPCATMHHTCCPAPGVSDCCIISSAPASSSTPAEARYDTAPGLVAVALPSAGAAFAPAASTIAAIHPSPPLLPPPDFVTLYSSLLI